MFVTVRHKLEPWLEAEVWVVAGGGFSWLTDKHGNICMYRVSAGGGTKPRGPTPPTRSRCLDLIHEARVRLYSGIPLCRRPSIQAPASMTLSPNRHCAADQSTAAQIPIRYAEALPVTARSRHIWEPHGTTPNANGVSSSRGADGIDDYNPQRHHIGSQSAKVIPPRGCGF